MSHPLLSRVLLLSCLAAVGSWSCSRRAVATAPSRQHALLIGCTRYDHLPKERWLEGVPNDVPLLIGVLKARYGFTDADIRELTEAAAERNKDAAFRPTRANMEREFAALAECVDRDHQVLIWLSGHGHAQLGPNPPTASPKPDGVRQVFLPCDIEGWEEGNADPVKHAVVDFELRDWLRLLTKRGALVWVIVDACHSGTLCRSGPSQRTKELPSAVSGVAAATGLGLVENDDRLVALYACEPQDTTFEMKLPDRKPDDPWHGFLTYTLCHELYQARSGLTYRELTQNLRQRYEAAGRSRPRPLVEFAGQNRLVLGREQVVRGPYVLQKSSAGAWRVNGGTLHGLTAGSILEVRPPAGQGDDLLGHVQIATVRTLTAEVAPCTAEGRAAPELTPKLPPNSRCQPVFIDYGALRLNVAVVAAVQVPAARTPAERDAEAERRAGLLRSLNARRQQLEQQLAADQDAAFQITADPTQAQWLVCVTDGDSYLLSGGNLASGVAGPAAELRRVLDATGATWWLPDESRRQPQFAFASEAAGYEALHATLGRIARAELLTRVAAESATVSATVSAAARVDPEETDLLLDVSFFRKGAQPEGQEVEIDPVATPPARGTEISCRVKNRSRKAKAAVTVLHVDTDYHIRPLYPQPGEINFFLGINQRLRDIPLPVGQGRQPGREQLLVIAFTPTGADVPDFTWLAEPDLAGQRGLRGGRLQAGQSPLGQLLQSALFREGRTRGLEVTTNSDHIVLQRSWEPRP